MSRRAKVPTDQQFEVALLWLDCNEGVVDEEAEACRAVAAWIEDWRSNTMMRQVARQSGVSVKTLRQRLAGVSTTDEEEEN